MHRQVQEKYASVLWCVHGEVGLAGRSLACWSVTTWPVRCSGARPPLGAKSADSNSVNPGDKRANFSG